MYHAYSRRRKSGIIVPFLLLVVIALTVVLAFQVWSYFKEGREKKTENKAAVTVVSGNAEMKLYGEQDWIRSPTGSILREGDALKTSANARVAFSLLNGSFIRLNGDTEVRVASLRSYDGQDALSLELAYGEIWLWKTKSETVKTSFSVATDDMTVRSVGTILNVQKRGDTRIGVMEGAVEVDVKEKVDEEERIFDTFTVGVGQEAIVTADDLIQLRRRKDPEIVFALSDGFKAGDWYGWNMAQDKSPTAATVTVKEAVAQEKTIDYTPPRERTNTAETSSKILSSPVITEPGATRRRFAQDRMVVRGTVGTQTKKIMVKTFAGGKEDTYVLQKYEAGKTDWTYIVAESYGNLVPGNNRYEIIAADDKGQESTPAVIELFYEKEKTPADLSAPVVLNYGGLESNTIMADEVRVEGGIGKGIVKVFVNDFALTRYVPDSGVWVYYVKVAYGNLKEGENEYTVYGEDADGKKTPITKFVIKKLPKPAEAVSNQVL